MPNICVCCTVCVLNIIIKWISDWWLWCRSFGIFSFDLVWATFYIITVPLLPCIMKLSHDTYPERRSPTWEHRKTKHHSGLCRSCQKWPQVPSTWAAVGPMNTKLGKRSFTALSHQWTVSHLFKLCELVLLLIQLNLLWSPLSKDSCIFLSCLVSDSFVSIVWFLCSAGNSL